MPTILVPIDTPSVLYAIQGSSEVFYLTISEILQCLQIAILEDDVPNLPEYWKKEAIPEHRLIDNKEQACA
ncbi:MAG: hypothetical protein COB29_12745 [Sulfitobacter sp.]|nr:MAG: hypothetical protein COB29_12745 [Sulfitobacter sp.]